MAAAQILAVAIFVVMFVMIVMDKIERQWVTLGCGALTLIGVFGIAMRNTEAIMETLNIKPIITKGFWIVSGEASESTSGINWATIIFLFGMMVMVEGMAKAGFFRWLCLKLANLVNYKPIPLFITFMIMSAVLSMFIDSITVILFLAAVTIELAKLLKINPVPMIISEVFCANLGGSATMCGDPPNIIIGTGLSGIRVGEETMEFSFSSFLTNTGLIAFVALIVVLIYFYVAYHKALKPEEGFVLDPATLPNPKDAISSKGEFISSCLIFAVAVVLLVSHASTGLTVNIIGVIVATLTVVATLITSGVKGLKHVLSKVDYNTLLFFIGLFIVVGGLEQTGILEKIAAFIESVSGGNIYAMVAIIIWVSAIASAFVDNIPFAATMVPIILRLAGTDPALLKTLAYTLAMGTDIGGSATPIGASANVVGTSVAAKSGYKIGWGQYCKTSAPAMILVIAISMVLIFLRYC